jgi:uncharacterized glyoxalase superfamily protein PhnB
VLKNRSMPAATVIPEFAYPDISEAIRWLCDTFGFTLRIRIADHRAQLNVGDGAFVLTETDGLVQANSHSVMVRVEDVDGHYERATRRGARVLRAPVTYPYGERQYSVLDLAGHQWTFSQSVADVDPEEWGGTLV